MGCCLHNLPAHELRRKRDLEAIYHPYIVDGPGAETHPVTVFPRDPQTGLQVWSGDTGYPADGNYLDFHKKRWPGGHRYWQVTLAQSEMEHKQPYYPEEAQARTLVHAEHFADLVTASLQGVIDERQPPILASLFDAELFGHWWFEGPLWLEQVARIFAQRRVACCSGHCQRIPGQNSRSDEVAAGRGIVGQERQQRSVAQRPNRLDLEPPLPHRARDARRGRRRSLARWRLGRANRETNGARVVAA